MVNREVIEEVISKSMMMINKCGPTIKQRLSSFNPKDFKSEKYSRKNGQIRSANPSPIGPLQKLQEDLQGNVDYTNEEKSMLSMYSVNFWPWSGWFYHKGSAYGWELDVYKWHWEGDYSDGTLRHVLEEPKTFKEFGVYDFEGFDTEKERYDDGTIQSDDSPHRLGSVPFPKSIEILDNMIEKSPPLQQNTVLYRVGFFDENLKPGETGKFKSYTSTSFNSYVAKNGIKKYAGFNPSKDSYQLKIYAPEGTKGVVPCHNTGCRDWQSEFTLGRNQKYVVINVDHYKKTAEILLY